MININLAQDASLLFILAMLAAPIFAVTYALAEIGSRVVSFLFSVFVFCYLVSLLVCLGLVVSLLFLL